MIAKRLTKTILAVAILAGPVLCRADDFDGRGLCTDLPSRAALKTALAAARENLQAPAIDVWAALVNRDGVICAVIFTGADRGDQIPGGRLLAAQKAYTANAVSVSGRALSTGNLFSATQPGGSLFGLADSHPTDPAAAYRGDPSNFGQGNDPLLGQRLGGINASGGGLALYDKTRRIIGAIGVSGDTACADHNLAWATRALLKLDYVSNGVSGDPAHPDNIVYDISTPVNVVYDGFTPAASALGVSHSGWGHPLCDSDSSSSASALPPTR